MEIGVQLGADVPFFIFGKTAFAEGIGEVLTPLDHVPQAGAVVVNPNIHVSTASVYQNLQLTSWGNENIIPRFYESIADICSILSNDLESVTINRYPIIADIKEQLRAAGACGALMSGSGPTVFGVFAEEGAAQHAAADLGRTTGWFTAAVSTL